MNYINSIEEYLNRSNGTITAEACRLIDIPTVYLTRLVKDGVLFRVRNGIYISNDGDYDELYFFQHQFKKAIFSYETALFLLGQSDKIPMKIDVTVYSGYKFNYKHDNVDVNYVKKSIYNLGVVERPTIFGNTVRLYSYERILCDFITNKDKMDPEIYIKAIKSYANYEDKDINMLFDIAKKMGIENKVRDIMELVYE